jgi:hypothetical protein
MSVDTLNAYRLKVRVGDSEFDAEGPEETVKSQFELFLSAVNGRPHKAPVNGTSPKNGDLPLGTDADPIGEGTWNRFYKLEGEDGVSLKVLPQTANFNGDALILLLFGFLHLKSLDTVSSGDLLAMAKKSGLRIDRIDRSLSGELNQYINRGGSRKGTRYSLNNRGQSYAQGLLETEAEK